MPVLTEGREDERRPLGSVIPPAVQGRPNPIGSQRDPAVVLVADDDDALRQTVAEILSLNGHAVIQAHDGYQALALLRSHAVNVLVIDLAMPRVDGIGVLVELDASHPKVIVYSAFEYYSVDQLHQMGLGQKVFRVLHKPVAPRQLLDAVGDALAAC